MKSVAKLVRHSFKLSGIALAIFCILAISCWASARGQSSETVLAITNASVQRSEDGAPVPASFKFLPGEFVHFTFQIAGFRKTQATDKEPSKLALDYTISLLDAAGVALAQPIADKVNAELNVEDKDWTPKRRVSFQLPSFVSAGKYQVHAAVKDEIGNAETTGDYQFQIGGPVILSSGSVGVQAFEFFRSDNDREPLEVAAYRPGDNIFARFRITGFKKGEENRYRLSYRVTVQRPDGKAFLRDTPDVDLTSKTFYPAPYLPAEIDLTTSKDSAKGQYRLTVLIKDLIAQTSNEYHTSFSIE